MNHLDRYHVPAIASLRKIESATIKESVDSAISRIQTASLDNYNTISALSTYWASDDTGGIADSSLFIKTISKLKNAETNVETKVRVLVDEDMAFLLQSEIATHAQSMTGSRRLFILHYAGHAVPSNASEDLYICETSKPASDSEEYGSRLNMSLIKDTLKNVASNSQGLDVLILLDCCHAAIAGRGRKISGERVELMAATSGGGLSNTRWSGTTFTQHWCKAFDKFLERELPFNCNDIEAIINSDFNLSQFPATFVLREGWGVPITFCAHPHSATLTPVALATQFIVTALYVVENPDSQPLDRLILNKVPVPITVLAALPVSSTLLLLRIPLYFQELLVLPRVSLVLTDK